MRRRLDSSGGRSGAFVFGLVWAIGGCAAAAAPEDMPITRIAVVRDCSGCPTGSSLVLHRDGVASYTLTGKARLGTADVSSRGVVRIEDFSAIATFVLSAGFFEMNEVYDDPQTADGSWSTITITRGAQDKQVFRREHAGPEALRQIEARVDAVRKGIQFVPEQR